MASGLGLVLRFVPLAALALAGCTSLSTNSEVRTAVTTHALTGVPYALPMLQLKLDATRALAGCPQAVTFTHDGDSVTLVEPTLAFSLKVVPTASQVPGERYAVDYEALSSFLKTTSFGMENHASGTLKAINVSADDQSGAVLADVVGIGLSVAGILSGPAGSTAVTAAMAAKATGGGDKAAAFVATPASRSLRDRRLGEAIQSLRRSAANTPLWMCEPEVVAELAKLRENSVAQKKETMALTAATGDVQRLTVIAGMRRSRPQDVAALDAALASQNVHTQSLKELTEKQAELAKPFSRAGTDLWPRLPTDDSATIKMPEADGPYFEKMLVRQVVLTITPDALADWVASLTPDVLAFIATDNSAEALRGLIERHVRVDGTARKASDPTVGCAAVAADGLVNCLKSELSYDVSLRPADPARTACPKDVVTDCVSSATVRQGRIGNGRFAMDGVSDGGLFVRPPEIGLFEACRNGGKQAEICPPERRVAKLDGLSAPQLGQLRFLPFRSAMFEAASISLELREDGSIVKFEYKRPRAAAASASAAVKDALGQYIVYGEKRDAAAKAALVNARAEELAGLQFQIDRLTKQKALVQAEAVEQPDALAAVRAETAAIEAQVALLNARLAQSKAEAALAGQGS
jgi:hypothetical protein